MVKKGMEIALRKNRDNSTTIVVNGYGIALIKEKEKRMLVATYWAKQAGITEVAVKGHFVDIFK